ncbi:MAG: NAD+ synthase [Phycisphaerales bacterium]|nr:NAD+ synthase [Phycisphaerales bacterium]
MKILVAQQNYIIGDLEHNTTKILQAIQVAKITSAQLVIFPELALSGYPPNDLLYRSSFWEQLNEQVNKIRCSCDTVSILLGLPTKYIQDGNKMYNSVHFISNQTIKHTIHKTLLPSYDVFEEKRYFSAAPIEQNPIIIVDGIKIAVTICEDIWHAIDSKTNYTDNPLVAIERHHPDLIVNCSASPFDYKQAIKRQSVVEKNIAYMNIPFVYCNTVGVQTDIIFDGGSFVYDPSKKSYNYLPFFEESLSCFDMVHHKQLSVPNQVAISLLDTTWTIKDSLENNNSCDIALIAQALIFGVKEYFTKTPFRKAVIGLSGGIDSAIVLALAQRALGAESVQAILLPSAFSSDHSVTDAVQLCKNLGVSYTIIPINHLYDDYITALKPVFKDTAFSIAEENMQSRIRGTLLMSYANKFNYLLLNTSNKSELATGYGTLYGDMAGALSPLGDCYKTQVYELANYLNSQQSNIPLHIIQKAPSAELKPNQKDSDSLPDYDILDKILYAFINTHATPCDLEKSFDSILVKRVWHLLQVSEYKRKQFCPILRISARAFGFGWRMPIVGKWQN